MPGVPIVESSAADGVRLLLLLAASPDPLPVLRVKFDDPAQTWVYIDPEMSRVAAADPPAQSRRALVLQRPAQPRLRVLVQPAPAVGHRHDRAAPRWTRDERHRCAAWRQPAAACGPATRRGPDCHRSAIPNARPWTCHRKSRCAAQGASTPPAQRTHRYASAIADVRG